MGGEKLSNSTRNRSIIGSPPRRRGKGRHTSIVINQLRITPAWAGKRRPQQRHRMALQDHPRMGGEKNKELEGVWLPMGSPPRRRGKVVHCAAVRALRGITPRVGGEKPFLFCGGSSDSGSPPHRRGKVRRIRENLERVGITPAQAGKRSQVAAALQSGWDHPRVGGEKGYLSSRMRSPAGSPPRGRGKVSSLVQFRASAGITPAWAGKRGQHFR